MAINPGSSYPAQTLIDPAYPWGRARNVATDGDGTGTPWTADVANDLFGLQQKILRGTGQVPTGTPESLTSSQYYEALRMLARAEVASGTYDVVAPPVAGTPIYRDVALSPTNGRAVIVGSSSVLHRTANHLFDGSSGTSQTAPASTSYNKIIWSTVAGMFIAIGGGLGAIHTSPDGATWTARTSPLGSQGLIGIAESDSLIMVSAENGHVITSADGISWSDLGDMGSGEVLRTVLWSSVTGTWIVAGSGNRVIRSDNDGASWTTITPASFSPTLAIDVEGGACSGASFVLGGSNGTMYASHDDGLTWTQGAAITSQSILQACWCPTWGCYAAVAGSETGWAVSRPVLMTSGDGLTWTRRYVPTTQSLTGLAFLEPINRLVLLGVNGTILASLQG